MQQDASREACHARGMDDLTYDERLADSIATVALDVLRRWALQSPERPGGLPRSKGATGEGKRGQGKLAGAHAMAARAREANPAGAILVQHAP